MDKKILLAIGNQGLEEQIGLIKGVNIFDSDSDIDVIADILKYETIDMVIVNTVLSEGKSLHLAKVAKVKETKIIALIESYENKEFIASLFGLGVKAFVDFSELQRINEYISSYPDDYEFFRLQPIEQREFDELQVPEFELEDLNFRVTSSGKKIVIGIFNVCSGAGCSTTSILLAESFAKQGLSVCAMEVGEEANIEFLDAKRCHAIYLRKEQSASEVIFDLCYRNSNHQIIFLDFGRVFDINAHGDFQGFYYEENIIKDFLRCDYLIGMSFDSPWHEQKLKYFIENEMFRRNIENGTLQFIVSGEDVDTIKELYKDLIIYNRNSTEDFINALQQSVDVGRNFEGKAKKCGGRKMLKQRIKNKLERS